MPKWSDPPPRNLFPEWLAAHAAAAVPYSLQVMRLRYGPPPRGVICKTCCHLQARRVHRTYYKCDRFGETHGAGTDWRIRWPGCGGYEVQPC